MNCQCGNTEVRKVGRYKNKHGIVQRYLCTRCNKTFSDASPLNGLRTDKTKIVQIVKFLVEGIGVNATARLAGCHVHTAAYNFCKKHATLGTTPAVGSKLTDHIWSVEELVETATNC